jgi:hypothetical protein
MYPYIIPYILSLLFIFIYIIFNTTFIFLNLIFIFINTAFTFTYFIIIIIINLTLNNTALNIKSGLLFNDNKDFNKKKPTPRFINNYLIDNDSDNNDNKLFIKKDKVYINYINKFLYINTLLYTFNNINKGYLKYK